MTTECALQNSPAKFETGIYRRQYVHKIVVAFNMNFVYLLITNAQDNLSQKEGMKDFPITSDAFLNHLSWYMKFEKWPQKS